MMPSAGPSTVPEGTAQQPYTTSATSTSYNTLNITAMPASGNAGGAPACVEITINPPAEASQGAAVSHLEGLTVEQMIDLDIDALAVKIDRHHCHTKKSILDHFMETKARLMQAQNEALDEERRKCASKLAAKEEEIKLLQAELDALRLKLQRMWEVLGRAGQAIGASKERRRNTMQLFHMFYAWREQAMLLAQRKRRMERAERWYVEVHLKRNVFRAWFRTAMREHRVTVNNRYIQEVEKAKRLIHEHYQGQIADLERLLADAHLQLEREAEARARLEENMKRAFMRGVCALNIEAMQIMKRGAPPGGANPFGIPLPPNAEQQQQEPPPATGDAGAGGSGQAFPGMGGALADSLNLDLRGSITLSPRRLPAAGAAAAAAVKQAARSAVVGAAGGAATSITGTLHMSAAGPQVPLVLPGGAVGTGGSSRPSSGGQGQAPALVVKGPGFAAGPAPGASTSAAAAGAGARMVQPGASRPAGAAAPAAGEPVVRETAQAYYQRPPVMVTRGPGMGGASGGGAEAPRPRAGAPLPSVRMS